jgi:Mn-dependent DtxR family transcriptional regulator
MDAAERVRHVALTRTTPRNAGWIATEADVSRDTAVKYLSRMAEQGGVEVVETAEGTCYKPDPVTQFLDEVRDLAETHSQEELTAELRDIADEIDRWKREYDVESLAELRQSVGDDGLSAERRHERLNIVEEWEYDVEMREAIRLAIGLTESLTELGAGTDSEYAPDRQPQES